MVEQKGGNLKYHLSQRNRLLRTDFLAAKTRDTKVSVDLGELMIHRQGRYRTLLHAGAAARTQLRINLRSQERPTAEHLLNVLVVEIPFTA
jgi:hypothetical protein